MSGRAEEGIPLMTDGLSDLGAHVGSFSLTLLADAYRIVGQSEVALAHLTEAERQADLTHVRWCQSETLRTRAVLLALRGDWVGAEATFRRAIPARAATKCKVLRVAYSAKPRPPLGRNGASRSKLANCSLRSTGGSLRGSIARPSEVAAR